jgi:DNA phosphorothioation-associated putative methyltransferase
MSNPISNFQEYRSSIDTLRFGKKVGPFVYLHNDGLTELTGPINSLIALALELAQQHSIAFNIVKIGARNISLSLLNYPGFWRQAFPVLSQSAKLNLDTYQFEITNFESRKNRPVLHRKELLLPPGHSHFEKFAALTVQAEELGLFKEPKSIGLQNGWRRALKKSGVKIVGHRLVSESTGESAKISNSEVKIERHKTAMRRQYLSQPMQTIQRFGYLDGTYSIFDYGCGRGDDLEALKELNVPARGWDPHYRPSACKTTADVINLGFVVNVIEDKRERDQTLQSAFSLAKKFLVVSALVGNPDYAGQPEGVRDGFVTSIRTFQKYYGPDELENYVRSVLKVPVVPIAQGVVLAFVSEDEADRFRARRAGARRQGRRGSLQQAADLFLLDENARDVLSAFWDRCLELGREPLETELSETASLEPLDLSPSTAFVFLSKKLGIDQIEQSAQARKEELLIQFALGQFDGRVYYKYLPEDVQKDISVFFGGFVQLQAQAKELLFSISDTDGLTQASEEAASNGYGYMLDKHSLQLHTSLLERLPSILQVYVGCALRLVGGIGRADLIKIHTMTGKVSLLTYDDFDGQPIPSLMERVKVNLWARQTSFFDYIAGHVPPPLLMKSLFLPEDHEVFADQSHFDGKLMNAGLFDVTDPHPTRQAFQARLENKGFQVKGYDLISATG